MSLFRRRSQQESGERSGTFSLGQLGMLAYYGGWRPGLSVGLQEALRNGASRRCILLLSGKVATTDLIAYRKVDGRYVEMPTEPPLVANPSALLRPRQWRRFVAFSLVTDDNAFGLVRDVDSRGLPTQIELVDPSLVRQREVVGGVRQVNIEGTTHRMFPFGDLWHVAGETAGADGFGRSRLVDASNAIGTSLAAEDFGARFFTDSGIPPAILRPEVDPGPDVARAIKQAFLSATQGNREPVVLPKSTEYERIQVDPSDSQFIELLRWEVENTCRFWGVPPVMVYGAVSGSAITYANVTQADLQFLKDSLSWLFDAIEEELYYALPRPQKVMFDRDSLLKGDPMSTTQMLSTRLRDQTISVNEYRMALGYEPLSDPIYDQPGIPAGVSADVPAGGAA